MSRLGRDRPDFEPLGIGEALRQAREAHGLSLSQVAQETRIRASFLLALEEEEFGDLPAPVYARGFLRTYASYLGLDPAELIAVLDSHHRLDSEPALEPAAAHVRPGDSVYPKALVPLLVGAVIVGLTYFVYVQYSAFVASQQVVPLPLPTSVPAIARRASTPEPTLAPSATPTALPAIPTAASTPTVPTATPTAAAKSASATPTAGRSATATPTARRTVTATPTVRATATARPVTTPTPPPGATPTAQPSGAPPPAPSATASGNPATVEARFSGDCWVQAQVDDAVVLDGVTLKAGDLKTWTGRKFSIKFGNAGAVDLVLNGKPATRLGATGQVVNWDWTAP